MPDNTSETTWTSAILAETMEQEETKKEETLIDISRSIEPWTKLGMDIFIIEDKDFLIKVDYTTNYFERDLLLADLEFH